MGANIVADRGLDNAYSGENQGALFANIINKVDPGGVTVAPTNTVALTNGVSPGQQGNINLGANQGAVLANVLNNIDPSNISIDPVGGIALTDQVPPTQLQERIPVPTNYLISARFKITPAAFVGTQVPADVQERMLNVEVGIAWFVEADTVNQGGWDNFVQAAAQGTLFLTFKFPNDPKTTVFTVTPSTGMVQMGHGFSQAFNLGLVAGAVWGNYRGGVDAVGDQSATLNGRVGVTMTVPAISGLISNGLATAVDAATSLVVGALLTSGAGSPLALAADYLGGILQNVVRTGSYGIGASWRGEITVDANEVLLYGATGTRTYNREDFARAALTFMAWDMRNFGIPEIANSKMQWQLEQGSSYFQLSPVTGGWSRIAWQGSAIEVVPRRNYGDPGMALINYLNVWGQSVAQNVTDPNATSPLTYRDLTPPPASNGLPSRQWVRMYQNIESGAEAVQVVQHLKQTLSPATWQQFLGGLSALAEPLGLNLGLAELNPVAPATPVLQQARAYLDRDWNKNSNPQETRFIEEIPQNIYDQIRADLGLNLVASTGGYVIPDYIAPDVPVGDPSLAELFPSDFTNISYANLTSDKVQTDAAALTPVDGIVLHPGPGGGTYLGTERNDILRSAGGVDNLNGMAGDDLVVGSGLEDGLAGGEGNDVAAYLASQAGVTIDIGNLANVTEVEAIGGSNFADTITTSTARNLPVYGFAGDDVITGGEGAIIYGDYSPEFLERFGASLRLDPANLPGGNDQIDMKNAATGTVLAGGGNDAVTVGGSVTLDANGNVTALNIAPTLALDGGAGEDTLVIRLNAPTPLIVGDIPAGLIPPNAVGFEKVRIESTAIGVPGINGDPVAHVAPEGWTVGTPTPDIISGNGPWPGGGWITSDIDAPSPYGGSMAMTLSNAGGPGESIKTSLTGLIPGQVYSFQFAWQQATLSNPDYPALVYSGGGIQVRLGDNTQIFQATGSASTDAWKTETLTFTATSETMEIEMGVVPDDTPRGIVFDTFGPAIRLDNSVATLVENSDTSQPTRVADIVIEGIPDPSQVQLSLSGTHADKFEIVGNQLFLKAGVVVDYESLPSLDVRVNGDYVLTPNNPDTGKSLSIAVQDVPDTASIDLANIVTNLAENTDTAQPIRVADLVVSNQVPANYSLTLAGTDADKFQIIGNQLFLRAGVVLDYETRTSLSDIQVVVDDLLTPLSPDDTEYYYLNIDNVAGPTDPNDVPYNPYG